MPDLLTPDELAAIAEREAKATEGPWKRMNGCESVFPEKDDEFNGLIICSNSSPETEEEEDRGIRNMDFIAHARADIPALLRHIAALEARTPAPALPADMEALLAEAEKQDAVFQTDWQGQSIGERALSIAGLRIIASRLATALRETLAREQAERERAEKAEAERDEASLHVQRMKASTQWDTVQTISEQLGVAESNVRILTADLAAARKELAGLGPVEQEVSIFGVSAYRPRMEFDSPDMQVRAIRRVLEGGAQ